MPEIIELLSSSPPKAQQKPKPLLRNKSSSDDQLSDLNSDDFGSIGDLNFLNEPPAKRRRLSPPTELVRSRIGLKASNDGVFELSSEPDISFDLGPHHVSRANHKFSGMDDFDIENHDIITFSSSAPEPVRKPFTKEPVLLELSSDIEPIADDPIQTSSQPALLSRPMFSERTANLLAGLHSGSDRSLPKAKGKDRAIRSTSVDMAVTKTTKFKQITKPSSLNKDDIISSSQPPSVQGEAVPKQHGDVKNKRTAPKTTSKPDRAAEKEVEKEKKRLEKEQKAQEKQRAADIAEANKSKTNKKNSTPEMIVDMPSSLQNLSVGNQVEEYMKQLDVKVTFLRDEEVDLISDNEVSFGHIVKWRRKVTADFDEDLEIWKPLPQPRITHEKHIIVYLKAEEFVNVVVIGRSASVKSATEVSESAMKTNLDTHVQSLRTRYPQTTIVYLIEGLSAWNRKSANLKNKAYTASVRAQVTSDNENNPPSASTTTQTQPRRTNKRKSRPSIDLSSITPDTTETLLLHLQLHHQPLLIHHTTSPSTTASQITILTQHLSTRPYRLAEQSHNLASASFCMTTGQIRTGSTPHETYINMLQEINRVTPSMAYGISAAGYDNVGKLSRGFREDPRGNLMLEDVKKSVNKDGAWSDRRLGPMVSKRLFRVFMGRDPGARDGIA